MVDVKLDDRMAFEAWVQAGTLEKASKLLAGKGSYNVNTGQDWHPGSIRQASNRFILNNVAEAREVFKQQGSMMNENQWNVKLLKAACKAFSRKNFMLWANDNSWALQYPLIVKRRFPGLAEVLKDNVSSKF